MKGSGIYGPLPLVFVLVLIFASSTLCDPLIDGVISQNEWPANSTLRDYTNNNYWLFTWNGTDFFAGYYTTSTKNDIYCFFQTNPEYWRYPTYNATGTTQVSTAIAGTTLLLPFRSNVLIKCATQCDYLVWSEGSYSWIQIAVSSLQSAAYANSSEFSISYNNIANSDDLSYMACYTAASSGPVGISTIYDYFGLPLDLELPVSILSLRNTFPGVTSSAGTWNYYASSTAWTTANMPVNDAENSDYNAIIDHDVIVNDAAYATSLTVTEQGSLEIPYSSSLTLGLNCQFRHYDQSALVVYGTLLAQGDVTIWPSTQIYSSSKLTFNSLTLKYSAGLNTFMLYTPINITGELQLQSGLYLYSYSSGFYYNPGSVLRYIPHDTQSSLMSVGVEWTSSSDGTSSWNSPYAVAIPYNTSLYLGGTSNSTHWIKTWLSISGSFQFSAGTLNIGNQLVIYDTGYLSTTSVIRMSSHNIESTATVLCSGYGALELQDGSPWKPFSVQVYQPETEHVDTTSEFNTTFDVETSEALVTISDQIITNSLDISWSYLTNMSVEQVNLTTIRISSSGTVAVKIRLAPDYCWRSKQITLNLPSSGKSGNSDDLSKIVGGIAIAVVGVLILGGIAFFVIRRRRNKNKKKENENDAELASVRQAKEKPEPSKRESHKHKDDWEIKFADLKIGQQLGRGAFGIVYKAQWRNTDCVVKQMDIQNQNENSVKQFLKEVNNVKSLRVHPNVCMILGVCTDPQHPICIVMEYLSEGSLDNLIYNGVITVDTKRVLQFSKDIASGMSHLHAENVLHCDLACRNILVSNKGGNSYILKIADFGLSKVTETSEYSVSSPNTQFPIRWSAPETLRAGKVSRASDVWSFGVVMWEICEAKRPYPELTNSEVIKAVCDDGHRLSRPTKVQVPDELDKLMRDCWRSPQDRPSFDQIYEEICRIEELYFPTSPKKKVDDNVLDDSYSLTHATQPATNYSTNYSNTQNYEGVDNNQTATGYQQFSTAQNSDNRQENANNNFYGNATIE